MKHIKYIVFMITGVIFHSCSDDFLNPLPETAVAVESFFQSDADVLAGVIGIYDALQGVNENTTTNIGDAINILHQNESTKMSMTQKKELECKMTTHSKSKMS